MPERPDLEYVVPILDAELRGRRIEDVRLKKPVVLRNALRGDPARLLVTRRFVAVQRRSSFVLFVLEGRSGAPPEEGGPIEIVVSPMLAGRFALSADAGQSSPGDLALGFLLDDGRELRYRDDVQMGKVYLIPRGGWDQVPGLAKVGVDVLDPRAFTLARFREMAAKRRDQAKVFLMDKTALDELGNAYADEVLFEAKIHPKTFMKSLAPAEVDTLHDAIVKVLSGARDTIAARKPALDEKLRDFLKVRNRHGEPCPRCGDKIRKAGVHGHDAFFCPTCQPETRKSGIVDWKDLRKPPQ